MDMGCCNLKYREAVEQRECQLNEKGTDRIPASMKWIMGGVLTVSVILFLLLN